jgi:hypothetical protein
VSNNIDANYTTMLIDILIFLYNYCVRVIQISYLIDKSSYFLMVKWKKCAS